MNTSRRSLLKAGAWSTPAIIASATAPVYAASLKPTIQTGLFVTTHYNRVLGDKKFGFVGYSASRYSRGHATTPQSYFSSAPGSQEADNNWNDSTSSPTDSPLGDTWYTNGEGSFTPVNNSAHDTPGTYLTSSGFWFSVPTTSATTGDGYIPGSTATLAAGAVFVTQVEFTSAGLFAWWLDNNVTVEGKHWNTQISGNRTTDNASATYLQTSRIAGQWTASAPSGTLNANGSYTFKGTITYTTSQPINLVQKGTTYYAQTEFMPEDVRIYPGIMWKYFSLTSSVQSASITFTANGITQTQSVSGLTTTSRLNP